MPTAPMPNATVSASIPLGSKELPLPPEVGSPSAELAVLVDDNSYTFGSLATVLAALESASTSSAETEGVERCDCKVGFFASAAEGPVAGTESDSGADFVESSAGAVVVS